MLIATSLFFFALRYLPLADAVAIHFIAPILITAFSIPILKEQVGWRRWAAIFVGFIGALIIIRPGGGGTHWAAILLPLGSAVCYAIYQILTRIASKTDSTQTSLFWTSVFGVGVTSLFVPFVWVTPTPLTEWRLMSAPRRHVWRWPLFADPRPGDGARLAPVAVSLYPDHLGDTLFGLIFFGQFPDGLTIAGAAVVIASGLYIWWRESARAEKPSAD